MNRLIRVFVETYNQIKTLNLFESRTARTNNNLTREYFFTWLFICMFIISSVAVGLYLLITEQNELVTVRQPSLETYEKLLEEPLTIMQCPCEHISIPYDQFLNVTFVVHQVCSSDLVSTNWLHYLALLDLNRIPIWTETDFSRDFRQIGISYFQLLATFCSLAKTNIEENRIVFLQTNYINDHLLSRLLFRQQTKPLIQSFISETHSDFVRIMKWTTMISLINQSLTGTNINFKVEIDNQDNLYFSNVISLSEAYIDHESINADYPCSCAYDTWYCLLRSILYTNGTNMLEFTQVFYEVSIGCIPLISLLKSEFQWWYNETYMVNIRATYDTIMTPEIQPPLKPLNKSISSIFNDTELNFLVNSMFLEKTIISEPSYEIFYKECAPISCSYLVKKRRDVIVAILLIVSVCGGLSQGIRLITPLFGSIILFFIQKWRRYRNVQVSPISEISEQKSIKETLKSIKNLNIFELPETNAMNIRKQQLYTRTYLFLFTSVLVVIIFYTFFTYRMETYTYMAPQLADYEALLKIYPDTLDCPCTKISNVYGTFINQLEIQAFHQVCTTKLVYVATLDPADTDSGLIFTNKKDFKSWKDGFVSGLKQLCAIAEESTNSSIQAFKRSNMWTYQVLPRLQFHDELNKTLERFKLLTPLAFNRILDLIRNLVQGNALLSLYSTNWKIVMNSDNSGKNDSYSNIPVPYNNSNENTTCLCATRRSCSEPAQAFNYMGLPTLIPGFVLGCSLLETMLLSSLTCLYSINCIDELRYAIDLSYYGPFAPFAETHESITNFDSELTRYNINDTIETMAYNLFIETWISNVSYDRFFNACAPAQCTYTYYYRFDILETLTTFLSVFGGLSVGLRFITPYLVEMFEFIYRRLCTA